MTTRAGQMSLSTEMVGSAPALPPTTRAYHFSQGLHADLNETYPVGMVDEDSKKLMRVTRQALDAAIRICKPGALIRDIGKVMSVSRPLPLDGCVFLTVTQK